MNEDGTPFKSVRERSQDAPSVARIPARIKPVKMSAVAMEPAAPPPPKPMKNRVMSMMSVGKRPLQGTRELVKMAMSRSLGESMIRHP